MTPKIKAAVFERYNHKCIFCGSREKLHIHHIDINRKNNSLKNLLLVCVHCHFKCHGRSANKDIEEKIVSLRRKGVSYGCIAAHLKVNRGLVGSVLHKNIKIDPTISEDSWIHRDDMEIDIITGEILNSAS
jgi:hypothetical protein